MKNTKLELLKLFKDEETIGIWYEEVDEENEISKLPEGYGEFGICTNSARYIRNLLGNDRVDIYGFSVDDNPVEHEEIDGCGGHDFPVVDKRFIVDIWISHFTGCEEQFLYDLNSPKDREKIKEIYGDPSKWSYMLNDSFIYPDDTNYPQNKKINKIALDANEENTLVP